MASRIAAEEGWTLLDTIDLIRDQAEFNELVQSVAENCPNEFSAAENIAEPGGTASIHFKGDALPLCAHGFLQDINVNVSVVTGALENELEINEHADEVGEYLANNGYADFVVGSRIDGTIDVTIGSGDPMPTLPPAIAGGVVIELMSEPVGEDDISRGATQFNVCTAGFSVYNPSANLYGISTARHCPPTLFQTVDPLGNVVPTVLEDEGPRRWGDMEWHTTPSDFDENEIWIDYAARDLIEITGVMRRITRRTWICINAMTNNNTCDRVRDPRIRKNNWRRLVLMERRRRANGDSGGPWYRENDASGLHQGAATKRGQRGDCYSRAEHLDNSMGVVVRTW